MSCSWTNDTYYVWYVGTVWWLVSHRQNEQIKILNVSVYYTEYFVQMCLWIVFGFCFPFHIYTNTQRTHFHSPSMLLLLFAVHEVLLAFACLHWDWTIENCFKYQWVSKFFFFFLLAVLSLLSSARRLNIFSPECVIHFLLNLKRNRAREAYKSKQSTNKI